MQAAQILKAPLFVSRILFKLRNQDGGRDLLYLLRDRLGVSSDTAIAIGKRLKIIASPSLARKRFAVNNGQVDIPQSLAVDGWTKLPKQQIKGGEELARHCAAIFDRQKVDVLSRYSPPFTLVSEITDSVDCPEDFEPIVRFCSQPALFNLIAAYMGEYPVLSTIALGYTAPQSNLVGSQLFHCDSTDPRALHLVMPIWPIDEESGPFTFLPATKSTRVRTAIQHDRGRIPDEVMFSHISNDDLVYCTGEPGDVYLVNPYACLHCGARTRSKPRLILIINFNSLFQGPESAGSLYRARNRQIYDDGKRETRLLLNLQ